MYAFEFASLLPPLWLFVLFSGSTIPGHWHVAGPGSHPPWLVLFRWVPVAMSPSGLVPLAAFTEGRDGSKYQSRCGPGGCEIVLALPRRSFAVTWKTSGPTDQGLGPGSIVAQPLVRCCQDGFLIYGPVDDHATKTGILFSGKVKQSRLRRCRLQLCWQKCSFKT